MRASNRPTMPAIDVWASTAGCEPDGRLKYTPISTRPRRRYTAIDALVLPSDVLVKLYANRSTDRVRGHVRSGAALNAVTAVP